MLKNGSLSLFLWMSLLSVIVFSKPATSGVFQDNLYDAYEIELNGFAEVRQGWRLKDDPYEKGRSISEGRLQLDLGRDFDWGMLRFKGDVVEDLVKSRFRSGIREFNVMLSPLDFMDLKIGRQILTWGTGDLLFVNDLFPKDWQSFFIGRDDEYLKAPSDAVKLSFFFNIANLDVIYAPVFNGSVYIDGSRLSYWNPVLARTAGRDFIFGDHERNRFFADGELALRVSKNIRGTEVALYGYRGFWKTPEGMNPVSVTLYYPELTVYGASIRSTLFGGIGNIEIGYYDSREDREGDDPFVRNSEFKVLAGFERELMRNFTGGIQYYCEWIADYHAYRRSLVAQPGKDEYRHLLTVRLTRLMMNQNLRLSFFGYYSPSDQDAYLRPKAHYKLTDQWAVEVGSNIFLGTDDHTFFGQFKDNTNAYGSVRWGF